MKQLILRNDVKPIVSCLFVTLIAGLAMNMFVLGAIVVSNAFSGKYMTSLNEMALFLAIAGVPVLIYTKLLGFKNEIIDKKKIIKELLIYVAIGALLLLKFEKEAVIHFFVIAIAEEIHFRGYLNGYLKERMGTKKALIISSVIFAFVLHLNDNILMNLIVRFPLGIVLCLVNNRFGLSKSVGAHWIYDVIVSTF